ncbi:MAG: hypothetical protein IJ062_08825 [Firmicutes bacterium]|nr:hypothetical protein [Bacillota bacterium]
MGGHKDLKRLRSFENIDIFLLVKIIQNILIFVYICIFSDLVAAGMESSSSPLFIAILIIPMYTLCAPLGIVTSLIFLPQMKRASRDKFSAMIYFAATSLPLIDIFTLLNIKRRYRDIPAKDLLNHIHIFLIGCVLMFLPFMGRLFNIYWYEGIETSTTALFIGTMLLVAYTAVCKPKKVVTLSVYITAAVMVILLALVYGYYLYMNDIIHTLLQDLQKYRQYGDPFDKYFFKLVRLLVALAASGISYFIHCMVYCIKGRRR